MKRILLVWSLVKEVGPMLYRLNEVKKHFWNLIVYVFSGGALPRFFEYRRVKNGVILAENSEGGGHEFVYQDVDSEGTDLERWSEFLNAVTHHAGPSDYGRYSDERLYICTFPGDKNEGHSAEPCPVCGRSPESE